MKKVLFLSYHDYPAEGHAYSRYLATKAAGYDVYFISLISEFLLNSPAYFFNFRKKWTPSCLWFRINRKTRQLLSPIIKEKKEYCFCNSSNYYIGDASKILAKIPVNPDVIILGWYDYFISPRTIYDLYNLTKAKIVIPMVDAHILGGGCHFPCDCNQYTSGCALCPALLYAKPAKRLYQEKMKYLMDTPFVLVGTSYDLARASKVPFLCNKEMLQTIGTPSIPFVKSKVEARKEFDIHEDDFVIMCGAQSLKDKRKGFVYLLDALKKFSTNLNERKVTFLMIGGGNDNGLLISGINVVSPGFLSLEKLFTAYYASDVFMSTSIDDSGPYMINYSLACGIPVISFPVGIAMDLVKHGETGYLADFLDVNDLVQGIRVFYEMDAAAYHIVSKKCISLMKKLGEDNTPWFVQVLSD